MEIFNTETLIYTIASAGVIAMIYYFVMQKITTKAAEKLISENACGKDSAKTLDEIGFAGLSKKLAKYFLSGGNAIAKAVEICEDDGNTDKKESDDLLFKKVKILKYYIPKENDTDKLKKHLNDKFSLPKLILAAIIVALCAFVFTYAARFLENYAKNVFSRKVIPSPTGVEVNENGNNNELNDNYAVSLPSED